MPNDSGDDEEIAFCPISSRCSKRILAQGVEAPICQMVKYSDSQTPRRQAFQDVASLFHNPVWRDLLFLSLSLGGLYSKGLVGLQAGR